MSTQTPINEIANFDLLGLIPTTAKYLFEIGCSSGALAREYKKINSTCCYKGLEIDESYAQLAKRHCDEVIVGDVELLDNSFWLNHSNTECWIFADVLEHLKDPWSCLRKISDNLTKDGCVVACIPNVQHWSMQVNISMGQFIYQDIGLLDKTHLRWFTRKTILQLFSDTGFQVQTILPRIFNEPDRDNFLSLIQRTATRAGGDALDAIRDAIPMQYLVKAIRT
jgi:2-polyprenyl-3-methyl-5-hydroxy-6-metoxy-1,4-benzoquinol methylase